MRSCYAMLLMAQSNWLYLWRRAYKMLWNNDKHGITYNVHYTYHFSCHCLVVTVVSVSIKTLKMLIVNYKVRKYHNSCILNHIVASTFTTACLVCLSIVGMLDIHLISWRKSTGCHIINEIFSISVGAIFAFKTFSVVIIVMKIMFPFAHQCQWLKKTFLLCSFIWVTFFLLYSPILWLQASDRIIYFLTTFALLVNAISQRIGGWCMHLHVQLIVYSYWLYLLLCLRQLSF